MRNTGDQNPCRPDRPAHISSYAEACLTALASRGVGRCVFRGVTEDVDAWWTPSATAQDRHRVLEVIEDTLRSFGQVHRRTWGDVASVELLDKGQVVFSFQVAHRSAQLEPPAPAPWTDVLLDSFADLLASKMVALVERGAPRDLRDIHALCKAGLTTPEQCWTLWRRRQRLAGSDVDSSRARLAVETHIARIAQHRPLAEITDPQQREEAERTRNWFSKEFLHALTEQS